MKLTVIEKNTLSIEEYVNQIRPYLKDIINNLKLSDMSKIQLIIAIDFTSSKNNDEERVIHSKSDNTEFMTYENEDKVTKELFESLLNRYQIGLKASMRGSGFIFGCANLLYYKFNKINPNRGGSYKNSPE